MGNTLLYIIYYVRPRMWVVVSRRSLSRCSPNVFKKKKSCCCDGGGGGRDAAKRFEAGFSISCFAFRVQGGREGAKGRKQLTGVDRIRQSSLLLHTQLTKSVSLGSSFSGKNCSPKDDVPHNYSSSSWKREGERERREWVSRGNLSLAEEICCCCCLVHGWQEWI